MDMGVLKSVRITAICNPAAGQRGDGYVKAVLRGLLEHGDKVDLRVTRHAGHATEIARECAENDTADLIVAAGGDGTVREVAEGLLCTEVPIGIIPAGTANVLARELGYMQKTGKRVSRAVEIIAEGLDAKVYPFTVEYAKSLVEGTEETPNIVPISNAENGSKNIGMCWVGAGFDAEVLRQVNVTLKGRLGRAAFVPAILKSLLLESAKPSVPWVIKQADSTQQESGVCGWGLVSNIARYAGDFQLTGHAHMNEPGLACLLFNKVGWFARSIDQLKIAFGPLDDRGETRVLTNGSILLGDKDTPIQIDGDFVGVGPVKVKPMRDALIFKAARPD